MARRDEESDEDERSDSDASSSYDGSGSGSEGEEEVDEVEEQDDEEIDRENQAKADAKHKLVEDDLVEIKKMMDGMDKIKMRLQFRLGQEPTNAGSNASSPRRRSSVQDIYVPKSASAAVQTTWDMTRMFEVEKVVSATADQAPVENHSDRRDTAIPVNKSVQLSIQDLARSYGVQDALHRDDSSTRIPSPSKTSAGRATAKFEVPDPNATKRNSLMWEGLRLHESESDHSPSRAARESGGKPSKLDPSPFLADASSDERLSASRSPSRANAFESGLQDSFGSPVSPTNSSPFTSSSGIQPRNSGLDSGKTVEQKEMEAMQSLLFS